MHMIGSDGPLSTLGCHVIFDRAAIVETCCSCDQTEESEVSSGVQVGGDVSTGALDSYKDTPWHSHTFSIGKKGDVTDPQATPHLFYGQSIGASASASVLPMSIQG